ncbi:MAG: hypothetical protein EZS28_024227 [Streblomastix strix]|uniref:Uncharacterized protein n=1 Tax=Streblomastix strix TaxID=222440 RepID=A0A5J4VCR6_9EUKA|nr:MAG: hypothetical protein EZS28_024227 [Streblomastix strix]
MWQLANEVNVANLACEPIVKFDNENEQQKHQQKIHQVAIFGFNFKKFDFNIIFPYLVQHPKIISKNNVYLGSTTQQKQVTIRHTDYQFRSGSFEQVFKDVLTFILPTTLDNFIHKYGNGTKLTKGNDNEYQEYVDDFKSLDTNENKQFKDRWAYLEFYNIRDVEVSNSIKYNYALEDFDINGDYNKETGNKEYIFYSEKWNKKVEGYLQQDIKAGRDTTNNVTAYDMDYFNRMIPNKCCYCQAKFTSINKPTFERINNNISHTKDNCKLACQL